MSRFSCGCLADSAAGAVAGARLDQETREQLREELFEQWLNERVMQLLSGREPAPLSTHLLKGG